MRFHVRVFDASTSAASSVVLEGASDAAVRDEVQSRGLVVLDVRRAAGFLPRGSASSRVRVRALCIEVAALLRAGMSLPEAVESLAERAEGVDAAMYRRLHESLVAGMRLSDAMEQSGERFPAILIAAVRAGERTSGVADVMQEYARYDEAVDALRRGAVNAAVYPAMVVAVGVLVGLFLLGYVVPRFARIYESTTASASAATKVLLSVGTTVDSHRLLIALGLLAMVGLGIWIGAREDLRARVFAFLGRLRPVAGIVRRYQLARITQAMAMLLRGGYPLPEAMHLAGALALRPDLARGMAQALQDVRQGRLISQVWVERGLGTGFDRRLLQAGERIGQLGTVFAAVSQTYAREVETAMERASRFVEPVLLLVVALLIGTIVGLMYMPIFDLAGSLR
jgi:general secretion pathway protein F